MTSVTQKIVWGINFVIISASTVPENSMTSSERPSPEALLKKEACPAVLRGREFWKCSGGSNALNYRIMESPAVAFPASFRNLFQTFLRKVPAILGAWPKKPTIVRYFPVSTPNPGWTRWLGLLGLLRTLLGLLRLQNRSQNSMIANTWFQNCWRGCFVKSFVRVCLAWPDKKWF